MEAKEIKKCSIGTFCNGFVDKCFKYVNPFGWIECDKKECEFENKVENSLSSNKGDDDIYVDPFTGELHTLDDDGDKYGLIMERESNQSCFPDDPKTGIDQNIVDDELLEIKSETSKAGTLAAVFKKIILIAFHLVYRVLVCQLSDIEIFHGYGSNVRLCPEEVVKFKWDILITSSKLLDDLANNVQKLSAGSKGGKKTYSKENVLQLNAALLFKLQNALFGLRHDSELIPDKSNNNYTWIKEEIKLDSQPFIVHELYKCIYNEYINTMIKIHNKVSEIVTSQKTRKRSMDLTANSVAMMKEESWQTIVNKNEQAFSISGQGKSPVLQEADPCSFNSINVQDNGETCRFTFKKSEPDEDYGKPGKRGLCDKTGMLVTTRTKKQRIIIDTSHESKNKHSKGGKASSNTGQYRDIVPNNPDAVKFHVATPVVRNYKKSSNIAAYINEESKLEEKLTPMENHEITDDPENGITANEIRTINNLISCPKEINYPLLILSIRKSYEHLTLFMKSKSFDFKQWIKDHVPTSDKDSVVNSTLDSYLRNIKKSELMQRLFDIKSCKTDSPSRPALAITKVRHVLDTPDDLDMDLISEAGASKMSLESLSDKLAMEFQTLNRLSGCINCPPNSFDSPKIPSCFDWMEGRRKQILSFDNIEGATDRSTKETLSFEKVKGIDHIPITESTYTSFAFLIPNRLVGLIDCQASTSSYHLVKLNEVLDSSLKQNHNKIRSNISENLIVNFPKGSLLLKDSNVFDNSGKSRPPSVQSLESFSFSVHEAISHMPQSFQLYHSEIVCCDIVRVLLAIVSKFRKYSWFSSFMKVNGENRKLLPKIEGIFEDGVFMLDKELFQPCSTGAKNGTALGETRDLINEKSKENDTVDRLDNLEPIKLEDGTVIKVEVNDDYVTNKAYNEAKDMNEKIRSKLSENDATITGVENEEMDSIASSNQAIDVFKSIVGRLNIVLNENSVFILRSFCNQIVVDGKVSETEVNSIKLLLEFLGQGKFTESSFLSELKGPDEIIIRSFREYDGVKANIQYHIIQKRTFPQAGFQYIKMMGIFHVFGYVPYPFELCTLLNTTNMKRNSMQTKLICSVCLKVFTDIDSYIAHEFLTHIKWFAFVCSKCNLCLTSKKLSYQHTCHEKTLTDKSIPNENKEDEQITARIDSRTKVRETCELCDSCVYVLENLDKLISHIMTKSRVIIFRCDECSSCFPQRTAFNRHKTVHKLVNKRKLVLTKCQICYQLYDVDVTDNQMQHTSPSTIEKLKEILYTLFENMESQAKAALKVQKDMVKLYGSIVSKQDIQEWKSYLSDVTDLPYDSGIHKFNTFINPQVSEPVELATYNITKEKAEATDIPHSNARSTLNRLNETMTSTAIANRGGFSVDRPSDVCGLGTGEHLKVQNICSLSHCHGKNELVTKHGNSRSQRRIKTPKKWKLPIEPAPQTLNKNIHLVTTFLPPNDDINTTGEISDAKFLQVHDKTDTNILGNVTYSEENKACENDRIFPVKIEPIEIDDGYTDNPVKNEPMEDVTIGKVEDICNAPPKVIDKPCAKKLLMETLLKCDSEPEMKRVVSEALQWRLNDSKLFTEQEIILIVSEVFQILESRSVKNKSKK